SEILCRRICWFAAPTVARQLGSVVNTSIWSVRCRTLLNKLGVRIGATNVPMHDLWEGIKRQQMFFIFAQTADRFWIAQAVFPFEGSQVRARFLQRQCFPNPSQLCSHLLLLTVGNGIPHIALLVHQTALDQR